MYRQYLILIMAILLISACNLDNAPRPVTSTDRPLTGGVDNEPVDNSIAGQIKASRREKDRILKLSPDSPIPKEERGNFTGLKYFPVDLKYRLEAKLEPYTNKEKIKMTTSAGDQDEYVRYGVLKFVIDGAEHSLDAFKSVSPDVDSKRLFIPFKDTSSGKETYGSGRYLELEENTGGAYTIDFNLAYNPYCAYNNDYSCPIPPAQNTLKIAIPAGEKSYHQ